jgi:hypothetical protein
MPAIRQQTQTVASAEKVTENFKPFDSQAIPEVPDETQSVETTQQECNVTVMSGSSSRQFPVARQKVGDTRKLLKAVLNIADNAIALVNGVEVSEDVVLQANDRLEFVRRAGRKGAALRACASVGGER